MTPPVRQVSPLEANRFTTADLDRIPARRRQLLERRRTVLGDTAPLLYRRPIHPVRGEGTWLYDADGTRYLDMYNNVAAVGHCHPRVVEAVARQAATLNTHTRYLHDTVVDYAEDLLATFPAGLGRITFTCTGSEANDLAVRLARQATGRHGVVVTESAYHGGTAIAAACSPSVRGTRPEWVRVVPAPDHRTGGDTGARFAAAVAEQIDDLERHGIGFAALLIDTVFSSDGIHTEPAGGLAAVAATVRAAGGLLLADEVQPGFGRLGHGMWGFQRHGIVPDLVTLGKPMAAGMPVAAVVMTEAVVAATAEVPYFNTFGGNPVSMAAAQAVLAVIRDEALIANSAERGRQLRAGLRTLQAQHPCVTDIRGAGLFTGVEFGRPDRPAPQTATAVVNGLRDHGVLASTAGAHGSVLKIRPPLSITTADIDYFLATTAEVLAEVAGP